MDQGDLANNDPASNGADGLLGSLMDLLEDEEEFDEDDEDLEGQEAVEFMNSSDFDNMEGNMLDLMLEPAAAPQETFEPAAESEDWEDVEDLVVSVPEIWMPVRLPCLVEKLWASAAFVRGAAAPMEVFSGVIKVMHSHTLPVCQT